MRVSLGLGPGLEITKALALQQGSKITPPKNAELPHFMLMSLQATCKLGQVDIVTAMSRKLAPLPLSKLHEVWRDQRDCFHRLTLVKVSFESGRNPA